jgi:deazaflavin-dependent oxidoreductase (nitroreductase family)
MKTLLIKWFTAFNAFLIRISGGKVGGKLGSQTILLLHSVGRKSGKHYTTPIAYFQVDEIYFVIASNWGRDANAAWYFNLQANPSTSIEVDGKNIPVLARDAQGQEYTRLWKYAVEHHPPYQDYKKMTRREIPIVVFEPVKSSK